MRRMHHCILLTAICSLLASSACTPKPPGLGVTRQKAMARFEKLGYRFDAPSSVGVTGTLKGEFLTSLVHLDGDPNDLERIALSTPVMMETLLTKDKGDQNLKIAAVLLQLRELMGVTGFEADKSSYDLKDLESSRAIFERALDNMSPQDTPLSFVNKVVERRKGMVLEATAHSRFNVSITTESAYAREQAAKKSN